MESCHSISLRAFLLHHNHTCVPTALAPIASERAVMRGLSGFPLGLNDGHIYTWTDGLRRRDWHDNESARKDELRVGKGEHGKPYLLAEDECDDSVYKENGFNIYVSNNIALDRSLPDIRHPNCKQKLYLEKLPNTSIIIPFHNEGWSSLLRTIHSITNRTPDHLIAEIILVDDYSDRELRRVTCKSRQLERNRCNYHITASYRFTLVFKTGFQKNIQHQKPTEVDLGNKLPRAWRALKETPKLRKLDYLEANVAVVGGGQLP
ncbi:putative polypeptide N-acetylgalactosaminyltransferase-like 6 [Triplophysa rosa]|uniref:Polypeptide N-acetylgalactosaminyltransferase-like 6 n=1 Tax=Triplophysa rosa TaxID=992332 RepID=A0A9W8C8Q5_TRIRA|nr:putative polypeptide N-acetylgalactosaminyltransferase-like 6 [Triplophysa rosa]